PKNVLFAPSSRICADTYGISGASSDRPGMFTTQKVVITPLSCTSTSIDVASPVIGSVPRDAAYTPWLDGARAPMIFPSPSPARYRAVAAPGAKVYSSLVDVVIPV